MAVGPAHIGVDVDVAAVPLPELAGDDGVPGGDPAEVGAAGRVTGGEVVGVIGGDLGVGRVGRQVRQPTVEVAGPVDAGDEHGLFGAGRAHRRHQFAHPRCPVAADVRVFDLAAVLPAGPADVVGLGVEVEEDRAIALVGGGDAAPEVGAVVGVGHRRDPLSLLVAGRRVLEVEDHVKPRRLEPVDIAANCPLVGGAAELGIDAVDPQPAGLVQRHPHGVDLPALHHRDRGRVHRPVEQSPTLLAGILGPGAVHPEQPHRLSPAVDQVVGADADPGRGEGAVGDRGHQNAERGEGREQHGGQAGAHRTILPHGGPGRFRLPPGTRS